MQEEPDGMTLCCSGQKLCASEMTILAATKIFRFVKARSGEGREHFERAGLLFGAGECS